MVKEREIIASELSMVGVQVGWWSDVFRNKYKSFRLVPTVLASTEAQ